MVDTSKITRMAKDTASKAEDFISEKTVSKESRMWAAFTYVLVILLPAVVLLTDRKSDKFVAFHAYQSLYLTGAAIAYYIGVTIVAIILGLVVPLLGLLIQLLNILPLLVFLFCAWSSFKGKKHMLPYIGEKALRRS